MRSLGLQPVELLKGELESCAQVVNPEQVLLHESGGLSTAVTSEEAPVLDLPLLRSALRHPGLCVSEHGGCRRHCFSAELRL